jgi:hypothetical protein
MLFVSSGGGINLEIPGFDRKTNPRECPPASQRVFPFRDQSDIGC